jgi:hypothetical protein
VCIPKSIVSFKHVHRTQRFCSIMISPRYSHLVEALLQVNESRLHRSLHSLHPLPILLYQCAHTHMIIPQYSLHHAIPLYLLAHSIHSNNINIQNRRLVIKPTINRLNGVSPHKLEPLKANTPTNTSPASRMIPALGLALKMQEVPGVCCQCSNCDWFNH